MRFKELDGLRGVFSVMIVLYHLPQSFDISINNLFISHSFVFVDYFFCLSGFVISFVYSDKVLSFNNFKTFILKRLIRTYPLHFFTLGLYLIGFLLVSYDNSNFGEKFLNSLLLTNSTPFITHENGINTPSWSISSEIISYTLIGIVYLLFRTRKLKFLASLTTIIICIISLIYFKINYFSTNDFGFIRGLIGFNFGVTSFYLFDFFRGKSRYKLELIIPALLFLLFWNIASDSSNTNEASSILMDSLLTNFIMCLSIILLLKSKKGLISNILNHKYTQQLGLISYSIYLTHAFVFNVFESFDFKGYSSNPIFYVVLVLTVLVFSKMTHTYIEVKLGNYLKTRFIN
ncbi:MAG: acyltransferase [Flavobacteriaceae bacterium]|nr:acyltransferase [Flavobacteriaceae bacterium]